MGLHPTSQSRAFRRDRKSEEKTDAADLVERAREEGLLLLPVKPTPEMLIAGAKIGEVAPSLIFSIYKAMAEAYSAEE